MISSLFLVFALTQGLPDEVFQEKTLATLPAEGELDELSTGVVVVVAGGGKPPPEPKILFSPDLLRCAFIILKGGKRVVFVDGKAGEPFDDILYLQFSADGKTVGYVGASGEKSFVVVDGRQTGPYATPDLDVGAEGRTIVREIVPGKSTLLVDRERVLEGDFGIFPKLSPDGKRYACYTENRDQTQSFVFFEGVRSPTYRRIDWLGFSKRGGRFGYIGRGDDGDTVVVDGTLRKVAGGANLLTFSPDGRRVAYSVNREGWRICVDGEEGPPVDSIWDITFSDDSHRVAYAAQNAGRWSIVVDGKKGEVYDKADFPVLSSDGKRHWFRAVSEGRKIGVLVETGRPSVETTSTPALFSSDGSRYLFTRKGDAVLESILDGAPTQLRGSPLRFTPKTNRLIEVIHSDAGQELCVQNEDGGLFREIGPVLVHPEGKRIAYGALSGKSIARKVLELK